jgi:hypothetical protein
MLRIFLGALAVALFMGSGACSQSLGQSLGDVARENREKQNPTDPSTTPKPKVITNKDLPKDPDADININTDQESSQPQPGSQSTEPRTTEHTLAAHSALDRRSAQQRLAEQRAAENWQRQILAQKSKMASLQDQINELNASIHTAGESVQSEGPYNRSQVRELRRMAQMQRQLDIQRQRLDQMQEAARHAGMHTAVYDP